MNDSDINTSTPVTHPDGGRYQINMVQIADDERGSYFLSIFKAGFGSVFTGSPEQARAAGFRFGDDEQDEAIADIEALLTPEEPDPSAMRRAWLASEEAVRELEARVTLLSAVLEARAGSLSDLRGELATANASVNSHRTAELAARTDLDSFKDRVRNEVESAKKRHDLCIDGCNSFLEELGLPLLSKTFKVTVTRDSDGDTLLTVTKVEADDEDGACDNVRENFSVTATVSRITFDYEYDGEGEADWDEEETTDSEFDEQDDEYAEAHKSDAISFTAEEE